MKGLWILTIHLKGIESKTRKYVRKCAENPLLFCAAFSIMKATKRVFREAGTGGAVLHPSAKRGFEPPASPEKAYAAQER